MKPPMFGTSRLFDQITPRPARMRRNAFVPPLITVYELHVEDFRPILDKTRLVPAPLPIIGQLTYWLTN